MLEKLFMQPAKTVVFKANSFRNGRMNRNEDLSLLSMELSCHIEIGAHWYGDSFEIPKIVVTASRVDLKKLAYSILKTVFGAEFKNFVQTDGAGLVRGFVIYAARPPLYPIKNVKSFSYKTSRAIKQYPWYPWSQKCNPLLELPAVGICSPPDIAETLTQAGKLDMSIPHVVSINGYPSGLIKLARLLLDYANLKNPPEQIDLEVEGGFRGVAPLSYEIRFVRADNA